MSAAGGQERALAGDLALWERAVRGEAGAFGALFVRHADAVYNHCFRRTASWDQAEDLTSVVFLEAWRRRRAVVLAGDSVLPWLLAVANNAIRNWHRSQRRHRRLLARLPPPAAIADHAPAVAARIDDERVMRGVLAAFGQLSHDAQDVVALCDWAGLTYGEAAAVLGIPAGTVRSRLSRARERLRGLCQDAAVAREWPGERSRP